MTHEGQTSANLMAHEKTAAKTRGRSRHALGQRSRTAFVRSAVRDRALVIAGWVAVLGVVGGAWQFAAVHGIPTRIAGAFLKSIAGPPFTVDTVATVTAALTGAAIASFLGIACAFALAQSDIWRRIFDPYFTVLNGLPRVALAPLFLLWFGIGPMSKITLAASIT